MEPPLELKSLMDKALEAEYGISIKFPYNSIARYQRRRLYAEREKLRFAGNTEYDGLSFIIQKDSELLLVKRVCLATARLAHFIECRALSQSELPIRIFSRGKSRVGFCIS